MAVPAKIAQPGSGTARLAWALCPRFGLSRGKDNANRAKCKINSFVFSEAGLSYL